MCQIEIINIFLFFKYDDIKLKYNFQSDMFNNMPAIILTQNS